MTEQSTAYGRLIIGDKEDLFAKAVSLVEDQRRKTQGKFSWAFTGGSTPAEFYRWCVATLVIPEEIRRLAFFTVSDERYVPLTSDQSNFGNLDRELLTPLGISDEQRCAWPVDLSPAAAAESYGQAWARRMGVGRAYDVCFLGMGEDAHTASWFPSSPLLQSPTKTFFHALDVPGRGWRLTITPEGLRASGRLVVMTLGQGKAEALRRVFKGEYDPVKTPSQILKSCAERVTWLVDPAAASELG